MNLYEAHAQSLEQLENERSANDTTPAGSVLYLGKRIPAIVEPFTRQDMLNPDGGGITPRMVSSATIVKSHIPAGIEFRNMTNIQVADPFGAERSCQIQDIDDAFTFIRLTVNDKNQNA